jgi:hypothetical protein
MRTLAFPQRRDDVIVIEVGAEAVLYDPVAPGVHRVNAAALLVWNCCDGTADASSISADLAETFSEPSASTLALVEEVIEGFSDHGLLCAPGVPAPQPAETAESVDPREPPTSSSTIRRLGPYGAVDARFTIECLDAELIADELERVLGSLHVDSTHRDTSLTATMTIWSDSDGCHLNSEGVQLTAPDESVVVDFAVQQITRLAIEGSRRYLVLHASTFARNGRAVMLPARANSGKSTLATVMVEAGFDYLTDEASFLDLETGDVVAFPKPITLDPGSQQLLARLEPSGLTGGSTKWRIAPGSIRPDVVVQRAKLTHIILPTHDAEADNTLSARHTIDGVVAFLAAAVNVADHASHLDDLVALVDSCTVHSLDHDGIDGPRAAIESLFVAVR